MLLLVAAHNIIEQTANCSEHKVIYWTGYVMLNKWKFTGGWHLIALVCIRGALHNKFLFVEIVWPKELLMYINICEEEFDLLQSYLSYQFNIVQQ